MKKYCLSWILGGALLSLLILSSCAKVNDEQNYVRSPFITFIEFEGADTLNMVSEDDTVLTNLPFGIFVSATSNLLTNEELNNITVSVTMNGVTIDSVYDIKDSKYSMLHVFLPLRNGLRQISFTVIDNAGNTATKSVNVFVEGDEVNVVSIPNIEFSCNETDDLFNFYDFDSIVGYKNSEAYNHQSSIDFAFFHNDTSGYGIGTPSTISVQNFYSIGESWSTFTNAIIAPSELSSTDYDNIGIHYEWSEIVTDQHEVLNLEVNDILQFQTEAGNKGFIKIVDIDNNPDQILISTKMKITL